MSTFLIVAVIAIAAAWAVVHFVPAVNAWFWVMAGNSRTILIAYAAEILAMLDETKAIDLSALIGTERAGRVMAIMGLVMIWLRMVTRNAVDWTRQS